MTNTTNNVQTTALVGVVVEQHEPITMEQLCALCGSAEAWVHALVEAGILQPVQQAPLTFRAAHISRARKALRIQRDFNASFSALGLIMELMDELECLRLLHGNARTTIMDALD